MFFDFFVLTIDESFSFGTRRVMSLKVADFGEPLITLVAHKGFGDLQNIFYHERVVIENTDRQNIFYLFIRVSTQIPENVPIKIFWLVNANPKPFQNGLVFVHKRFNFFKLVKDILARHKVWLLKRARENVSPRTKLFECFCQASNLDELRCYAKDTNCQKNHPNKQVGGRREQGF